MDIAPIIRQSLALWQNPAFNELSPEDVVASANRCFMRHSLDLDLTPDAAFYTAVSEPFSFSSNDEREKLIEDEGIDDVSRIVRVESRSSTSTSPDDWSEESLASFDNWSDILERDGDFVTFYSGDDGLVMVVPRDVTSLEFRIIYRRLRERLEAFGDSVDIPSIYEPLFVYDIALDFGETIDNLSPEFASKKATKMPFLQLRRQDELARIERWQRSQKGNSPTYRRAFNDRRIGPRIGPRRFTINF